MPNDDLIAALERAAAHNEDLARTVGNQRCKNDAATIRAHIADLQAGQWVRREDVVALNGDFACAVAYDSGHQAGAAQERAKVVAWLRKEDGKGTEEGCEYAESFADQIERGAHGGGGERLPPPHRPRTLQSSIDNAQP